MAPITALPKLPTPPSRDTTTPPPAPSPLKRIKDYFVSDHANTATAGQVALAVGGAVASLTAVTAAVCSYGFPGVADTVLTAAAVVGAMAAISGGTTYVHERLDHHAEGPLADDFNHHHARPNSIAQRSFADHSSPTARFTTPALIGLAALSLSPLAAPVWVTAGLTVFLNMPQWGGQMHKWAHLRDSAPGFAKLLQRIGLAIDSDAHMNHHRDKFDTHFDLMTGWFNNPTLAPVVRYRPQEKHEAEGVTPFPLLSKEDRSATIHLRNQVLKGVSDSTTPKDFAILRPPVA